MRRDTTIGGYVFLALMVVAVVLVGVSILGQVLRFAGLLYL